MALTTPPQSHVVASTGAGAAETNAGEGGAMDSASVVPLPRLDHIPEEIVQILQQPSAKDTGMNKLGWSHAL